MIRDPPPLSRVKPVVTHDVQVVVDDSDDETPSPVDKQVLPPNQGRVVSSSRSEVVTGDQKSNPAPKVQIPVDNPSPLRQVEPGPVTHDVPVVNDVKPAKKHRAGPLGKLKAWVTKK